MRKLQVVVMAGFTAYAMAASAVGGGHGGGGAQGAGDGRGGGSASHGSAVRSSPAIGTHIAGGVGKRLTVVSQHQATIDGTPRMVVTVKLTAPLTSADKSTLRFHGFKQGTQYNPKEPADIYCPPTQLAVERGSACIGFVYR